MKFNMPLRLMRVRLRIGTLGFYGLGISGESWAVRLGIWARIEGDAGPRPREAGGPGVWKMRELGFRR